jgi:hypothetical protein
MRASRRLLNEVAFQFEMSGEQVVTLLEDSSLLSELIASMSPDVAAFTLREDDA